MYRYVFPPESPGQVSRSALKQPRSCNLFKALFCCLQAQDGPKVPPPLPAQPSQQALLDLQENGTVAKVTALLFLQHLTSDALVAATCWRSSLDPHVWL